MNLSKNIVIINFVVVVVGVVVVVENKLVLS